MIRRRRRAEAHTNDINAPRGGPIHPLGTHIVDLLMSCQIENTEIQGWRAVRLSNAAIEVTVLPDKGADIYEFVDRSTSIDVLMKTPWGLQPPGSQPRRGSGADKFLHNYEGAWQELFPNTGNSCRCRDLEIPLHGEVAILPWALSVEQESQNEIRICLAVECRQLPLTLTRRMRLSGSSPVLTIEETVRNLSDRKVSFVWGHHPVLGAPFLEAGCRVTVDRCTVHTPEVPFDPRNVSYACGQRAPWPYIRRIDGQQVDLRSVPGPDANTHDHACLTDLERGWIEVENPRLGRAFSLEWDPGVFRWVNNWRPFGGSHAAPLEGVYGIALEPWSARANLADAMATGSALSLEGGATLSTCLTAALRITGTT